MSRAIYGAIGGAIEGALFGVSMGAGFAVWVKDDALIVKIVFFSVAFFAVLGAIPGIIL